MKFFCKHFPTNDGFKWLEWVPAHYKKRKSLGIGGSSNFVAIPSGQNTILQKQYFRHPFTSPTQNEWIRSLITLLHEKLYKQNCGRIIW